MAINGGAGVGTTLTLSGTGVVNVGGTLYFAHPSATSGSSTINLNAGGTLQVNAFDATKGTGHILNLNGGTLTAGASSATWLPSFANLTANVQSNSTINNNGFGITIGQALLASTGGGLTFQGLGTTTLSSGANTYTGATNITAGRLVISSTGSLGNTAISVSNGATFAPQPAMGGSIVVGGASASLALANGATFDMSGDSHAGTLNLTGTLGIGNGSGGANLNFDLGTNAGTTVADVLAASGAATVQGINTIGITGFGASNLTAGTLSLITAASGLNTGGTFQFGTNQQYESVTVNGTPYLLTLSPTATAENVVVSLLSGGLTWTGQQNGTGAINGTWTLGGANTNWASGITPINYTDALAVTFNDFNAANGGATLTLNPQTVTLVGTVTPASVTFSNNAVNYVLNGGGSIAGTGGLTMNGTGTVTLGTSNTFSGNTTINSGTLDLANTNALRSSTVANGGTGIVFDSAVASHAFTFGALSGSTNLNLQDNAGVPNAVALTVGGNNATTTYSGIMGGPGSLIKAGTGTMILTGNNTYIGTTTVTAGTLQIGNNTASGSDWHRQYRHQRLPGHQPLRLLRIEQQPVRLGNAL